MTREQVIKGLECCASDITCRNECPYYSECMGDQQALMKDAIALIRELEAKGKAYDQVKWERDIAVGQLEQIGKSLGEKMDDVKPREWVSVKERLPEKYIDVLAWVTDPDPAFNDYIAVAWVKDYDGGWDSDSFIEDAYGTVTHWMPLPEPPKEG